MRANTTLAPIDEMIISVRGQRVILAADLARIYGVQTKALNQAVKRNIQRFPSDFLFQLTWDEAKSLPRLRSQFVTLKQSQHLKYLPYAFTEHGAIMAANVLKSKWAVQTSVFVVRAFVRLREVALAHYELAAKLKELEQKVGQHDGDIQAIIKALRQLMAPPDPPKKRIGFHVEEPKVKYRTTGGRV